jgi:GT2 family glycosyltransferase
MRVGIVVPTINLWNEYTKGALDSIFAAAEVAREHDIECKVMLIDNSSSDCTRDEAQKITSPDFIFRHNTERWGFQRSVNYGVRYFLQPEGDTAEHYNHVLICNNDILLHPEAIHHLVERFKASSLSTNTLGMVTCLDVRGECPQPTDINNLQVRDKITCPESRNPNFSAFMVNRACWEAVGEMDELFFPAYFEDNDFHYRMKMTKMEAVCNPLAMFFHYGSRTQNEAQEDGKPMVPPPQFVMSRSKYYAKWGGYPGGEKFTTPYNDPQKTAKDTLQRPCTLPAEPEERMM